MKRRCFVWQRSWKKQSLGRDAGQTFDRNMIAEVQIKLSRALSVASIAALIFISGCAFFPKRPPYPEPDRLVSVVKLTSTGEKANTGLDFLEYRSRSHSFGSVAAYNPRAFILTETGESERLNSVRVTSDFFHALRVSPAL